MVRSLLRTVGFVLLLNLLIKPAWLLGENLIQNHLGHEAYGLFAAIWQLGYVLTFVLDFGTSLQATRQFAAAPESYKETAGSFLGLRLLLIVAFWVVFGGVALALQYKGEVMALVLVLAAYHTLTALTTYFRAILQAEQRFRADTWVSVADKVFLLAVLYGMLQIPLTALGYAGFCLLSVLVAAVLVVVLLAKSGKWVKPVFNLRSSKRILWSSGSLALMAGLIALNDRMHGVFLERLVSKEASGLYAAAFRWQMAFSMLIWTISPIFFSRFAQQKGTADQHLNLLRLGIYVLALPMLGVCAACLTYGHLLFGLLSDSTPAQLAIMQAHLIPLALSLAVLGLTTAHGTYLSAVGKAWAINRVLVVLTLLQFAVLSTGLSSIGVALVGWTFLGFNVAQGIGHLANIRLYTTQRIEAGAIGRCLLAFAACIGYLYIARLYSWSWYYSLPPAAVILVAIGLPRNIWKSLQMGKQPLA